MPKFFDALSGEYREMPDWLDRTGSKARGRKARHDELGKPAGGAIQTSHRPGLGTSYIIGSSRSYNPKGIPTKVFDILDRGLNIDLLSPGGID